MKRYFDKSSGYWMCFDPARKMYIQEHQVLVERRLGRHLHKGERIHHVDHVKSNNTAYNLRLLKNQSSHNKVHKVWVGRRNPSAKMGHNKKSHLTKQAWVTRKKRYGVTGARFPGKLRRMGRINGKKK